MRGARGGTLSSAARPSLEGVDHEEAVDFPTGGACLDSSTIRERRHRRIPLHKKRGTRKTAVSTNPGRNLREQHETTLDTCSSHGAGAARVNLSVCVCELRSQR